MNECIGTCFLPHLVNSYRSQFQAGVRLKGVAVRKKEKKGSVGKRENYPSYFVLQPCYNSPVL